MGTVGSKLYLPQAFQVENTAATIWPITAAVVYFLADQYPYGAPAMGALAGVVGMIARIYPDMVNVNSQLVCAIPAMFAAVAAEFLGARIFGFGAMSRLLISLLSGFAAYEGYMQAAYEFGAADHKGGIAYLSKWQFWAIVLASLGVIYSLG